MTDNDRSDRLRALTEEDVIAAVKDTPSADLLEWFEAAELVDFIRLLAEHLFGADTA